MTRRAGSARPRRGQCQTGQSRNAARAGGSATSRSCAAHDKTLAPRKIGLGIWVGTLTESIKNVGEIAVVTSISAWDSGGMRRRSPSPLGAVEYSPMAVMVESRNVKRTRNFCLVRRTKN